MQKETAWFTIHLVLDTAFKNAKTKEVKMQILFEDVSEILNRIEEDLEDSENILNSILEVLEEIENV